MEAVFSNLTSANTNDALQAIELDMAPRLSAHWSAIYLNAGLFARIDALYAKRERLATGQRNRCGCWNAITWISCARAPC